jgi:hypothetical protein
MAVINEFVNTVVGAAEAAIPGVNLDLKTVTDSKQVRINSRSYTQTSGSSIAMQCKPNQAASTTGDVTGAEFSPRIASGLGCGALIGLKLEPILKGTSGAGTVSEVRGFQVGLTDENIGGRTITNDVVAMNVRMQLAAHTVSGDVAVIKVEAAGGAQAWDILASLPAAGSITNTTQTPANQAGRLLIKVGSTAKHIQLYTDPT